MALENALQHSITPLCTHLLKLGFDIFGKKIAAEEAFGFDNIDENKLQNIATCENKRLKRFAVEFPHEQHLLNLQSLLVALLTKLSRHLNDQNTSVAEFHRELARISVIVHEIDIELAKAKRRKNFAFQADRRAALIEEELVKLAADNNKSKYRGSDPQREYRLEVQARLYAQQREAARTKAKEVAEKLELQRHAAFIRAKAIEARALLNLYQLHLNRLVVKFSIEKFVERRIREKMKLSLQNMPVSKKDEEEILKETLTRFRLSPK